MWLKGLDSDGSLFPSYQKISEAMDAFGLIINDISKEEYGDKTLHVEGLEFVINRFNGASNKEQSYNRH